MKRTLWVGLRWAMVVTIFGMAAWVFLNRQWVLDQIIVWQYKPSAAVARLAERAHFSDKASFFFYASQPHLSNQQEFNTHCQSHEEQSVVLGCYTSSRIYVYNVSDTRLDGVKEVTAAHEMLHAAYVRLSGDERDRVDGLLEQQLRLVKDKKLRDRLKLYERTEPGEQNNELHSIFGTEIASLSAGLEAYYRQYFTDRAALMALAKQYSSKFTELEDKQERLAKELDALSATIDKQVVSYNSDIAALNAAIVDFNARADRMGGFASAEEFNGERDKLVVRQADLEATRTNINTQIDRYNAIREELKTVNIRAMDLQNSLDSTPAPVPSL